MARLLETRSLHALGGDFRHSMVQTADKEGLCGYFVRVRKLHGPTSSKTGVIVQKINRTFDVKKTADGSALAGATLNAYVTDPDSSVHADVTEYWEAFDIKTRDGTVRDTWGLPALIPAKGSDGKNTTKGSFLMTGTASYYDGVTAAGLGFTGAAVAVSGTVPSMAIAPTVVSGTKLGGDVTYQVAVTWDSSSDATLYSKVVDT